MPRTKKETPIIGRKIRFWDTNGEKHFGIVEDIVPDVTGEGEVLSVKCSALGRVLTLSMEVLNQQSRK